jgi:hypothetical protein
MASNPFGAIRRRLGRSIDWRVQTATDARDGELRQHLDTTFSTQRRLIDDALTALDSHKVDLAKVKQDELDSLRTLMRETSIGFADQQRAQAELLEQLDRRVRRLEARFGG